MDYSKIRFLGRHILKNDLEYFSYSGSGFEFMVKPESFIYTVTISLISELREHSSQYINIYVNDKLHSKIQLLEGNNNITIPLNQMEGNHIKVVKLNEVYLSAIYLKEVVLNGASFLDMQSHKKKIGFFGDSLTCGYGLLGTQLEDFTMETEDFTKAYPYLTASSLGMDYVVVARSGVSISRQIYVDQLFNEIFDTVDMFDKCDTDKDLDYAVINLGTNDNGAFNMIEDEEEKKKALYKFKEDYISLILRILKDNPNVKFLICYKFAEVREPVNEAIRDIYRLISENIPNKCLLVEFKPNNQGANYHPSASAHESASKILINAIKSL